MAASSAMEISGAFLKVNLAIVFGFCSFMPHTSLSCSSMSSCFCPLSENFQRFLFNSRERKPGNSEMIAAYVAKLKAVSGYCNFGLTLVSLLGAIRFLRILWAFCSIGLNLAFLHP